MTGKSVLDASTLPPATSQLGEVGTEGVEHLGLGVLWSRDEPHHVGEVILVPPHGNAWVFGRGESNLERRLILSRLRGHGVVNSKPLACPRISREQLRITTANADTLLVENVGSCALMQGDREVKRVQLAVGQVLALRNELLLMCVRRLVRANEWLGPAHEFGHADDLGVVGESAAAWKLREELAQAARQPFHVLILGPSGTGKELIARALHRRSLRAKQPLVSRNAATIPEGIADAELFGNARGYPNAGMPERPGLIGAAHESTLFLDEIGELPIAIQARLLRVLDNGEYQRLGETQVRHSNMRLLGATNRPVNFLKHDVLARMPLRIVVPDLNSRREDIPLLTAHLLRRHATRDPSLAERFFPQGDVSAAPRLKPSFIEVLVLHTYTTNVRELDAMLLEAALSGKGPYLELPPSRALHGTSAEAEAAPKSDGWLTSDESDRLRLLRRHRFSATLCGRDAEYRGNRQQADLHFRHLVCKALAASDWKGDAAIGLLTGSHDSALREKCDSRVRTFVANLDLRIRSEDPAELERALTSDWKGLSSAVLALVNALRDGRVQLRRQEAATISPRRE